jgi:hypothetical protein
MKSKHCFTAFLVASLAALSACTPAPKYKLLPPTEPLIITRGTSRTITLRVQRYDGYASAAVVTASAEPDGVTITPAQASITGSSQEYSVSVSSSVSPGRASVFFEPDVAGYGSGGRIPITVQ